LGLDLPGRHLKTSQLPGRTNVRSCCRE